MNAAGRNVHLLLRIGWTRRIVSLLLLLLAVFPAMIYADRTNRVRGGIDIGAAVDDNPFLNRGGLSRVVERRFGWSLTACPNVRLDSSSERSKFTLDYTFGLEQYESTLDLRSESHRAGARYEADLNARWKLRVADSYTRSPDFSGFLAFRGMAFTPEGIIYDFVPTAVRREGWHNSANLGVEWAPTPHSSLTFDVRHTYREYDDAPGFSSYLSNQQRYSGKVEYRKEHNEKTAWTVGYNVDQMQFEHFENARNHDLLLGVQHQATPSVSLRLRGGPSYTKAQPVGEMSIAIVIRPDGVSREVLLESYMGYNVDFGVTKQSPLVNVGFFYRRDNALNSGIGSVSTSHTVGLDFSRKLGRHLSTKLTAMGYDYKGQLDNPYDHRGINTTLQFDVSLTRYSLLTFGGSYQTQESEYLTWDMERRRVFATLRFFLPDSFQGTTR